MNKHLKLQLSLIYFLFFNCSKDGETSVNSEIETIIVQYTLTVTASEGGIVSAGGMFDEGTEVAISATPNEGYRFVGWEGDSSEDEDTGLTFVINSDLTFRALFEINTQYDLTLTVSDAGGGSVYVEGGESYIGFIEGTYFEGTEVSVTATPSEGYVFEEWSNGSTENPIQIIMTEDLSLEASFTIINSLSGK
jgi:uncharacterized repeat protein (TIGR02543 family)|tara:strand:- start:344 stop:922 length:579 start_codon:yes stop_codon:yes gene_type:complete